MNAPSINPIVEIESLDHEGHGVAHVNGKVVFVDGALTGEKAEVSVFRRHPKYDSANAVSILRPSAQRAIPRCPHFGRCGGCSLQHLEPSAQVAVKQRVLEENLARIGKVSAESLLPALHGPYWGYRYRARLSVRKVLKKGGVLVGFHEKRSSFIADMHSCAVLHPAAANLIQPMRTLINQLSNSDRIPQVEIAVGERVTVLVFRLMEPWNSLDETLVRDFVDQHERVQIWIQPKGPDTAYAFYPADAPPLDYSLPEFGLRDALPSHRVYPGQHGHQPGIGQPYGSFAGPRPGGPDRGFFLRLGQFHFAPRKFRCGSRRVRREQESG